MFDVFDILFSDGNVFESDLDSADKALMSDEVYISSLFNLCDTNKTGNITRDDLSCITLEIGMDEDQLNDIFNYLDQVMMGKEGWSYFLLI